MSAWLHAYALPLSGLEEHVFFPLFLVGTILYCHKSLCHVCLGKQPLLLLFGSLSGKLSSQQTASTIHDDSWWLLFGQGPVLPALDTSGHGRHFLSIHFHTRNGTGGCRAGKENAITLNGDVRPDMSQRSPPPSTAERQRNGFTGDIHKPEPIMLKNINTTKGQAHGGKLSF